VFFLLFLTRENFDKKVVRKSDAILIFLMYQFSIQFKEIIRYPRHKTLF